MNDRSSALSKSLVVFCFLAAGAVCCLGVTAIVAQSPPPGSPAGRVASERGTAAEAGPMDAGTGEAVDFAAPGESPAQAGMRGGRGGGGMPGVYKARVTPQWFADNTRFWYRNDLRGGAKQFVLVDAEAGTRLPAFDHARLAAALSEAAGGAYDGERLPFDSIEPSDDGKTVGFAVGGTPWTCDLATYVCSKADGSAAARAPQMGQPPAGAMGGGRAGGAFGGGAVGGGFGGFRGGRGFGGRGFGGRGGASPDGQWTASVRDNNVFVRSTADGREIQLSQDGTSGNSYAMLQWAPDGESLVAFRMTPGDNKEVHLIQWAPPGGGRSEVQSRPYDLPSDKFATYELNLFDVANQKQIKPPLEKIDYGRPALRWDADGRHFNYEKIDRGHQRFRIVKVDSHTGESIDLIDEQTETFIWTTHTEDVERGWSFVTWLQGTPEIVYASERDGWRHLYLVDAEKGGVKNQITQGEFVVRGIDRIDEENRQIWFRASGRNPDQDPYLIHYYRVDFDGSNLVALTEGDGNHTIQFSPDRKYVIDTYDRVDMAPTNELRRVSDGQLVCLLEKADISELEATGWAPPEVFVAKGRDGETDIWGIICRPRDFDPTKKYPVIEDIYAGPQGSFVPKTFSTSRRYAELTDLGFIVVKMDGMGTANRPKAFHDVCWHNLKDGGFPDRILWHQAVAEKFPYYDITRVGIYGTSAGGQSAAGAVLFHPEFYKAAVANCGCHDNRMDKASWNEQWMGYPVGPWYAECSNIDNAYRLQGHLMLVVGGMDTNVPPESTFRFVEALYQANKDFDLIVIPSGGHGAGGAYYQRRMADFFQLHLQGVATPNRNPTSGRSGRGIRARNGV